MASFSVKLVASAPFARHPVTVTVFAVLGVLRRRLRRGLRRSDGHRAPRQSTLANSERHEPLPASVTGCSRSLRSRTYSRPRTGYRSLGQTARNRHRHRHRRLHQVGHHGAGCRLAAAGAGRVGGCRAPLARRRADLRGARRDAAAGRRRIRLPSAVLRRAGRVSLRMDALRRRRAASIAILGVGFATFLSAIVPMGGGWTQPPTRCWAGRCTGSSA